MHRLSLHIEIVTVLTGNFNPGSRCLYFFLMLTLSFGNSFRMLLPVILEFVAESNRPHRNSSGDVLSSWKYVTYRPSRDKPRQRISNPSYEVVWKNPSHRQCWASRKQMPREEKATVSVSVNPTELELSGRGLKATPGATKWSVSRSWRWLQRSLNKLEQNPVFNLLRPQTAFIFVYWRLVYFHGVCVRFTYNY